MRFAHVMLRVNDLDESIQFYTDVLGMKVLKRAENEQYRYTLAFLGYGDIDTHTVLELTYNWGESGYNHGDAFGHLCMEVDDVHQTCEAIKAKGGRVSREPGPVKGGTSMIAFIRDPNDYAIELIEAKKR